MTRSAYLVLTLVSAIGFGTCAIAQQLSQSDAAAPAAVNPLEGSAAAAAEGHSLFNETCAHCHGANAVTGISERNLRRLKLRYGDDMTSIFHTTVVQGRPSKGMPTWGGALDEQVIWKIYTYLETVQDDSE